MQVVEHDIVVFPAGTRTESVRIWTRELFASEQITTVPLVKQAERGSDDPISRRRADQQDLAGGGTQRRNRLRTGDPTGPQCSSLTTPVPSMSRD